MKAPVRNEIAPGMYLVRMVEKSIIFSPIKKQNLLKKGDRPQRNEYSGPPTDIAQVLLS